MLYGVDVSGVGQGTINWDALNAASNFVIIQATYGTLTDAQFLRNRLEARRVQAASGPLGIGYYHYAYPNLVDATSSADYFVNTVWPLADGEILALDWEESYNGDHVAWILEWLRHVENRTGVKPLLYLNQSLIKAHDWSPVISENYGLWLADYDGNKESPGVATPWPVTAIRQWTDVDSVNGIGGHVDGDAFYGDIDAWNAYGYQEPISGPASVPTPIPESKPESTPAPTTTVQPPATDQPHSAAGDSPAAVPLTGAGTLSVDPLSSPPIKVNHNVLSPAAVLAALQHDVSWLGTTQGLVVLQVLGMGVGALLPAFGLPIPEWLSTVLGLVTGTAIHTYKNPGTPNQP